jgi:hypothetical protein
MAEHYYHSESSKQLRKLRQLKPDLFSSFIDFDKKVFADGALDLKTKRTGGAFAHAAIAMGSLEEDSKP